MDKSEIEYYFTKYYDYLNKHILKMGNVDQTTAEDMIQELFIHLYRSGYPINDKFFLVLSKRFLKGRIIDYNRAAARKAIYLDEERIEKVYLNQYSHYTEIDNLIDRLYLEDILGIEEKKRKEKERKKQEETEKKDCDAKVMGEILRPERNNSEIVGKNGIIIVSPINHKVLEYLADNPFSLYHLTGQEFEYTMSEIYELLGYDVTLTSATRDGGKDIILRDKSLFGDFVYYVECKKYAAERAVGVGVVRNLSAAVYADRVNGGIVTTTSYFTKDAREFILKNKLECQIKLQDFETIKRLLKTAVQNFRER